METKVINLIDLVNASIVRKVDMKMDPEAMVRMVMEDETVKKRREAKRDAYYKAKEAEARKLRRYEKMRKVNLACGVLILTFCSLALLIAGSTF